MYEAQFDAEGDYMSYVVTEPFGTIIVEFVCMLVRHGYLISVFNTSIISKVMHLDPFNYIRSGKEMEFADECISLHLYG